MHHSLCSLYTYELSGLRKGDEHPAGVWPIYLYHILRAPVVTDYLYRGHCQIFLLV